MKVGLLTGGGDCPGLNAVIRAVVRKGCFHYEDEFVGFLEGWRGLVEDKSMPLDLASVGGILPRGGTILRTSRTNPAKKPDGLEKCIATLKQHKIEALIAIGGDDTLSVAQKLHEKGVEVVGVPKTIDNDLAGTDFTFGFDTAVNIATEAIDRVHTTAEAHNRVMVVEVMGRDAGWIAMYSGIAGGADVILIPEIPFDVDKVAETIRLRHPRGLPSSRSSRHRASRRTDAAWSPRASRLHGVRARVGSRRSTISPTAVIGSRWRASPRPDRSTARPRRGRSRCPRPAPTSPSAPTPLRRRPRPVRRSPTPARCPAPAINAAWSRWTRRSPVGSLRSVRRIVHRPRRRRLPVRRPSAQRRRRGQRPGGRMVLPGGHHRTHGGVLQLAGDQHA